MVKKVKDSKPAEEVEYVDTQLDRIEKLLEDILKAVEP